MCVYMCVCTYILILLLATGLLISTLINSNFTELNYCILIVCMSWCYNMVKAENEMHFCVVPGTCLCATNIA